MNDREKIRRLLEAVPEYKLGYIIAYIQGLNADKTVAIETDLTDEEKAVIAEGRKKYAAGGFIPLDDIE